MRERNLILLVTALIIFAAFAAGRLTAPVPPVDADTYQAIKDEVLADEKRNQSDARDSSVSGARDANAYIEDCTLANAHKGICAIPCGSARDCMEKNGATNRY